MGRVSAGDGGQEHGGECVGEGNWVGAKAGCRIEKGHGAGAG